MAQMLFREYKLIRVFAFLGGLYMFTTYTYTYMSSLRITCLIPTPSPVLLPVGIRTQFNTLLGGGQYSLKSECRAFHIH